MHLRHKDLGTCNPTGSVYVVSASELQEWPPVLSVKAVRIDVTVRNASEVQTRFRVPQHNASAREPCHSTRCDCAMRSEGFSSDIWPLTVMGFYQHQHQQMSNMPIQRLLYVWKQLIAPNN